jgi:NAD-dependent deacetylase
MSALDPKVRGLLDEGARGSGPIIVLTGAGISAESGIPTFRGEEGYWTVGSESYRPEEMATYRCFSRMPEEVWSWYLYRRGVCRAADPNPGHRALVELEEAYQDRFLLVTQNVDGLHLRAGNRLERTYQIHGNIDYLRCEDDPKSLRPIPESLGERWPKERKVGPEEMKLLRCCAGGRLARPHVLWFDEYYNEELYHFESSVEAASRASLLLVIGSSGKTNLPVHMAATMARRRAPMVFLNPEPSTFSELAEINPKGAFLQGTAGALLPSVVAHLIAARA